MTASQTMLAGSSKSITRGSAPRMLPAGAVLDGHATHKHEVDVAVAVNEVWPLGARQLAEGAFDTRRQQTRIEAFERRAEPPRKEDPAEIGALRAGHVGRDVRPEGEGPP